LDTLALGNYRLVVDIDDFLNGNRRLDSKANLRLEVFKGIQTLDYVDFGPAKGGSQGILSFTVDNADLKYYVKISRDNGENRQIFYTLKFDGGGSGGAATPGITPPSGPPPVMFPLELTTSQIAKLSSKQVAALEVSVLNGWTTQQFAALSRTNVTGLTTAQIPLLSSTQISAFESADLSALTSKQWPAFTTSQIQQLSTTQINKLPSASLARLTTSQVLALTTAQFAALSPSNIKGLTTHQIIILSDDQISAIESADLVKLTSKQLATLSTQQIQVLGLAQLNSLSSKQFKALSGNQLGAFTTAQIAALSTAFMKGLSTSAIASLSPSFIDVLDTKQLAVLGSLQTKALTTAQLEVLSDVQIGALTSTALKGLIPSRIATLTTSQLAGLTSTNIKGLSSAQIATLDSNQVAAIDPMDWKVLTSTQLKGLSASSIAGLSETHLDFITTTGIKGLPLEAVKAMTTSQIASLSTIQLCALTSAQEAMWSTTQTSVLSLAQADALRARTPLALDLSRQGVRTRPLDAGITFDIDADGDRDQVGWIDVSMAYLVNDLNANGSIDSGAELFGDATRLSNGSTASDGFEALACLDVNEDGWLDAKDDAFKRLALWQDLNQNGLTEPGELATLDGQGILRIAVTGDDRWTLDQGNIVGTIGKFERSDGSEGLVADIWLGTTLANDGLDAKVSELGEVLASYDGEKPGAQYLPGNHGPHGDRSTDASPQMPHPWPIDVNDQSSQLTARLGDMLLNRTAQYPVLPAVGAIQAFGERSAKASSYESLTIKTLGPS
jgi:hypothetical protein